MQWWLARSVQVASYSSRWGRSPIAAAVEGFKHQGEGLAAGGVDVFWIETMSDLQEVCAAVEGLRQAAPDMPIVATLTFDTRGFTMMGVSPADAVEQLGSLGLAAIGGNCGNGPSEIEGVVHGMHNANPSVPLVAKSNAGMPEIVDGNAVYSGTPDVMAEYARRVRALGATIVGACCGSTPAHIAAMHHALHHTPALDPATIELTGPVAERRTPDEQRRNRRTRRG